MTISIAVRLFILTLFAATAAHAQPAPPADVQARAGDRSVALVWDAVPGAIGYGVYRSVDGGAYEQLVPPARLYGYADVTVENGRLYRYRVTSYTTAESPLSAQSAEARPQVLSDDAFLDLVAHTAFDFFWYEANPANGLIKDRSTPTSAASIASVGFGLTAYGVAAEKGWITRAQARQRTLNTLNFFWRAPHSAATDATGYRGFFYHFLDMNTGRRVGTNELSTIDTALLMGGVRYAGQFFNDPTHPDEARIRALSDSLFDRVDWDWASPDPPLVALGWKPELASGGERNGFRICNGGFCDWRGYNEASILYLQAIGSRTHPVPPSAWTTWDDTYSFNYYFSPQPYIVFAPLFGHQYSHVWADFRGKYDAYGRSNGNLDYFENSRRATLAQRAYTTANPSGFAGYDADGWGITASDTPTGYKARGALPVQNDDGTLVPTGPGGSYPFTPQESLASLRAFYSRYRSVPYGSFGTLWGPYGFRDAINPKAQWIDNDYIGIDQGPIVLMIENGRRNAVWNYTMRDPRLLDGMRRAGFDHVPSATDGPINPAPLTLHVTPSPARGSATATLTLGVPAEVRLVVYDVTGRAVYTQTPGARAPGTYRLPLPLTGLAAGVYVVRVQAGPQMVTTRLLVRP